MRIAFGLAAFLIVAGVVYYASSDEWRGSVMLIVLACAVVYVGLVFRAALRRASLPSTPETMVEEEVAEAEVTPTIWPFVISIAAVLIVVGAVVAQWVLIPGLVLLAGAGVGWFLDVKHQWHPGEVHAAAAAGGGGALPLRGEEQPDERDRE
jgi:hypothetical protein